MRAFVWAHTWYMNGQDIFFSKDIILHHELESLHVDEMPSIASGIINRSDWATEGLFFSAILLTDMDEAMKESFIEKTNTFLMNEMGKVLKKWGKNPEQVTFVAWGCADADETPEELVGSITFSLTAPRKLHINTLGHAQASFLVQKQHAVATRISGENLAQQMIDFVEQLPEGSAMLSNSGRVYFGISVK